MQCFCCVRTSPLVRRVKIRRWREFDSSAGGPESTRYLSYREEMTYRWGVVCLGCYCNLNNEQGMAEVAGERFNIAGSSRDDNAPTLDETKYRAWQQKEAGGHGLDGEG